MQIVEYHDEDLSKVVEAAFPALAPFVARMRTWVERTDIARLALMHLHGGIYADLDVRLHSASSLHALLRTGRVYLPFEKHQLVGQFLLIDASPQRHPLWESLAAGMVKSYDSRCYETLNTGPDRLTRLWNELCQANSSRLQNVTLHDGLVRGPISQHYQTGSWRGANRGWRERRRGELGCSFHQARVACLVDGAALGGCKLRSGSVHCAPTPRTRSRRPAQHRTTPSSGLLR